MGFREEMEKFVKPLKTKIANVLLKGVVDSVDYSTKLHVCKILLTEQGVKPDIERLEEYGMTSKVPSDSINLVGCMNGDVDQPVVLKTDHLDSKPSLEGKPDNTVIFYNKDGILIELAGNDLLITTPDGGEVNVNNGNLVIPV